LALGAAADAASLSSSQLTQTCALALKELKASFAKAGMVGLQAKAESCLGRPPHRFRESK